MELLGTLGIDLKLLLAQILNFLVLLFVLYKFAYKPILEVLDKRKKKIEESIKNAEKIEQETIAFEERRREVLAAASKQALKIIGEAKIESKKIKEEALKNAQSEANELVARAKAQIKKEKERQFKELKDEIAELVFLATSSLIKKKLDQKIDRDLISEELENMEAN